MNYELGYLPDSLGSKVNILERRRSYFSAQHLICISESTKRELLQVYPQLETKCPIEVIHHGCDFTPPEDEHREKVKALGHYILFVGGRQNYKRFFDVLEAFEISKLKTEGFKIVCTGAPFSEVEQAHIKALNLSSQVASLGKVTNAQLSALYEGAHCLVYPSIHEGFGMPLVEAMQHGCPVVACDVSCIPEITSDAAILVPPKAPDALAMALTDICSPEARKKLVERGYRRASIFSWDSSAEAHLAVYRRTAKAS